MNQISDSLVLSLARKHQSLELECSVIGVKLYLEPTTVVELTKVLLAIHKKYIYLFVTN